MQCGQHHRHEYSTYAEIAFYATDVIDQNNDVTEAYVEAAIQDLIDAKIADGTWVADQEAVVDGTSELVSNRKKRRDRKLVAGARARLLEETTNSSSDTVFPMWAAFIGSITPQAATVHASKTLSPSATPTTHWPTRQPTDPAPTTAHPSPRPTTLLEAINNELESAALSDDDANSATASAGVMFLAFLGGGVVSGAGVFLAMRHKAAHHGRSALDRARSATKTVEMKDVAKGKPSTNIQRGLSSDML